MKTPNTDLFTLIKSLSKSEKIYFKRSVYNTGESTEYIKLFDEIEKQKKYNEIVLKNKFSHIKQFPVFKSRLYETLLNSLGRLAESTNYNYMLISILRNADVLFYRGLYAQSEKLVNKALKLAREAEDFNLILQALNIQKKIILKQLIRDEKRISRLHTEESRVIDSIKNLSEYNRLFINTYLYFLMYGYVRNENEKEKMLKVTGLNKYLHKRKTLSQKAEQHYIETMHLFHTSYFDTDNAMKYNKASLELMEQNPALIKANVERYLATYQNYVLQFFYKGDYGNLETAARKLEEFLKNTKINIPRLSEINARGKLYDILLSAFNNACMFDKAVNIVKEAEKLIDENESIIDKSVKNITHQMGAFIYFTLEDYENALRLANRLLNDPDSLKFLEVYCFILLLRLLIHYEMGNYELIDYITKSTKRYLSKTEKLFNTEKIMLKFFAKAINVSGSSSKPVFNELLMELEALKNSNEENFFLYFDFISWCKSKLEGKKFRQVLTEIFEQQQQTEKKGK